MPDREGRVEERQEERGDKMADAAADMEERGMVETAKDLFSGAAGGIAQVLIGMFILYFFGYHGISSQGLYQVTCLKHSANGMEMENYTTFVLLFITSRGSRLFHITSNH